MNRILSFLVAAAIGLGCASCEGCVRKVAKKAAEVGLSAVEGVSEALEEHGEKSAEKAADALGKVVEGAGRSVERQLDEHARGAADSICPAPGRTPDAARPTAAE